MRTSMKSELQNCLNEAKKEGSWGCFLADYYFRSPVTELFTFFPLGAKTGMKTLDLYLNTHTQTHSHIQPLHTFNLTV